MKRVYQVVNDGQVFRWQWRVTGQVASHTSRMAFPSRFIAESEALQMAAYENGLYRCPSCGAEYDPTYGKHCPVCEKE